ncbi:MAG: DDE-type integrase/transposase/recombinase [Ilumatobacteraceae bacterium]
MKSNDSNDTERARNAREDKALSRHSAVSWIEQARTQGHSFGDALHLASQLAWGGSYYSPRTLEGWYYQHQQKGFEALVPKTRSDKGRSRALSPEAREALLTLRQQHPGLQVTALVEQLERQGILEAGSYHLASVYRLLERHGLDRQKLRALAQSGQAATSNAPNPPNAPTKAFEVAHANVLWMADVMYGPVLSITDPDSGKKRSVQSYLFGLIDDCSRLVPHAQYYLEQNLRALLDLIKQACERRGIPEKLYADNGKIFLSRHLKLVCANLGIRLIHAKPYAAWSKGKIERFFRTVQEQFQATLTFQPVANLEQLNSRFFTWLESHYHQRPHGALRGDSPARRYADRILSMRPLPDNAQSLFLAREQRRVRTDATITLDGKLFEVPVHLKGCRIDIHYDPFAITGSGSSVMEIWHQGIQAGLARPLDKHLNARIYGPRDYRRKEEQ